MLDLLRRRKANPTEEAGPDKAGISSQGAAGLSGTPGSPPPHDKSSSPTSKDSSMDSRKPGTNTFNPDINRRPGTPGASTTYGIPATPMSQEGSKLIVGKDIQLKGEITACDTLVVEGKVEASMDSRMIQVSQSGLFSGEAGVDTAEIAGRFEGSLTARDRLIVRSTGKVTGTVRYGRIEIEDGGEIAGDIKVLNAKEAPKVEAPKVEAPKSETPKPAATSGSGSTSGMDSAPARAALGGND